MVADKSGGSSRVLGIDFGKVRVGIALSDSGLTVATPHSIVNRKEALRSIKSITQDYLITTIVIGIPVHNTNNRNPIYPDLFRRLLKYGLSANSEVSEELKNLLELNKKMPAENIEKDLLVEIFKLSLDIVEILKLNVEFYDEKFTSKIVKDVAKLLNVNEKKQKGKLDDLAASVMLQSWLDWRKR
jgi:putative Holliday junction resolvase